MIYHVVAMSLNRVIGKNNQLPWHFPADLKHFKSLTTGQTVIMGRKTFDSIGKPLPNRENFVISRTPRENKEHLSFFSSIEEAIRSVKTADGFIIGGADIYAQTMNQIDGIYLTQIYQNYEGDAFYPEISNEFSIASESRIQEEPVILNVFFYQKKDFCRTCG